MELKVGFVVGWIVATDAVLHEDRFDVSCIGIRLLERVVLSEAEARADAAENKKVASKNREASSCRKLLGI